MAVKLELKLLELSLNFVNYNYSLCPPVSPNREIRDSGRVHALDTTDPTSGPYDARLSTSVNRACQIWLEKRGLVRDNPFRSNFSNNPKHHEPKI